MSKVVIQAEKLCKTYRRFEKPEGLKGSVRALFHRDYTLKEAVKDFDLCITEGECVSMIGPNGAGKTTLTKMLTGIIAPTSGKANVLGFTPNRLENELKRQYAVVMGQKSQLFFELTAADTFSLFASMYGLSKASLAQRVKELTRLMDVESLLNVQVRTLSLGERMKMELIVSLLHRPRVLFLDEPTIGLDAASQIAVRAFLREINRQEGTTLLLTSHYIEDIRAVCPRCVGIRRGEKIFDGATDAFLARYPEGVIAP